jgi:hypothetical protein
VAIVPVALPNANVSVCVNEEDALEIVIVEDSPIDALLAVTDEALGIVFNVCVPLAVTETA